MFVQGLLDLLKTLCDEFLCEEIALPGIENNVTMIKFQQGKQINCPFIVHFEKKNLQFQGIHNESQETFHFMFILR